MTFSIYLLWVFIFFPRRKAPNINESNLPFRYIYSINDMSLISLKQRSKYQEHTQINIDKFSMLCHRDEIGRLAKFSCDRPKDQGDCMGLVIWHDLYSCFSRGIFVFFARDSFKECLLFGMVCYIYDTFFHNIQAKYFTVLPIFSFFLSIHTI